MTRFLFALVLVSIAQVGLGVTEPAGAATQQTGRPTTGNLYGECEGSVSGVTLTCTPQDCSPGCAKMDVETAFGDAQICVCNYIGPQPFCCTIALTEIGSKTAYGNCGGICPGNPPCAVLGQSAQCFPF